LPGAQKVRLHGPRPVVIPLLSLLPGAVPGRLSISGLALCLGGELLERALFFRAAAAPKMPGGV
jgi:hypothetical protein